MEKPKIRINDGINRCDATILCILPFQHIEPP